MPETFESNYPQKLISFDVGWMRVALVCNTSLSMDFHTSNTQFGMTPFDTPYASNGVSNASNLLHKTGVPNLVGVSGLIIG